MKDSHTKLNAVAFGMSMGMVYAISIFVLGMLATYFDYGSDMVDMLGDFYPGYDTGLMPSLIGAFWGLLEGFIMGFLLGFFYNLFHGCCCSWCRCD